MVELEEIVAFKRAEVARRREAIPLAEMERRARALPAPRPFEPALRRSSAEDIRAIAEVKRASPSRGPIRPEAEAAKMARAFARAGASAVSVLTETHWFLGSDADVRAVSAAVPLPVLRKDFIVDPYQVFEARVIGADAVLLLATLHESAASLRPLIEAARSVGMEPLVEVHDEAERDRALRAGARVIGVNNRYLRTLDVDPGRALALLPGLPQGVVRVAESGISSREAVQALEAAGADAILVGEFLMASADPEAALRRLLGRD